MNPINSDLQAILRERAAQYRSRGEVDAEQTTEYLHFRTASLECAISLASVVSMLAMPAITVVPNMPDTYLGLFARRGILHEAFSLPRILNESAAEHGSMLMLRDGEAASTGIAVTEVLGILELPASSRKKINDPNWPVFLPETVGEDVYLLDTNALLKQLKNRV